MRASLLGIVLFVGCNGDIEMRFGLGVERGSELRSIVDRFVRPVLNAHTIQVTTASPPVPDAACKSCTGTMTKGIMERAMGKMKEMCQKAAPKGHECPLARICSFMAEHPHVAVGLMFEHVRPMTMSHMYCLGHADCAQPPNITIAELADEHVARDELLKNYDNVDWHKVLQLAEELGDVEQEEFAEDDEQKDDEDEKECSAPPMDGPMMASKGHRGPHVCPHCMKRVIRGVMMRVMMRVEGMCAITKCPKMQAMCKFAEEHRGFAMGALLGKVEPWKFAFGFCLHAPHGQGHHRGQHHGPHGLHDNQGAHQLSEHERRHHVENEYYDEYVNSGQHHDHDFKHHHHSEHKQGRERYEQITV